MGRPKGSKNKPRAVPAKSAPSDAVLVRAPKPDFVTIVLTAEDLAPIMARKAAYERAAADHKRQYTRTEIARREAGEIAELSVPQVVPFSLSDAYHKAALAKAKAAGFVEITALRKETGVWMFEGLTPAGLRAVQEWRKRDNEGAQAAAQARWEERNAKAS